MNTPTTRRAPRIWLAPLAMAGCVGAEDPEGSVRTATQAISGVEGTLEYALDAPWRMEPLGAGGYGAIPLQVTLHDADRVADDVAFVDRAAGHLPTIGDVCSLTVREGARVTTVAAADFEEIERSLGAWSYNPLAQPDGPARQRCERSPAACAPLRGVTGTSEWHGLVLYNPATTTPGVAVPLALELRVTRAPGQSCADASQVYLLRNEVLVRLGPAPLPRFGGGWAYGDLHYHSQGTDNEGESAYNYRGVSRAMQSLGLDFVWATEHASASEQFVDVDLSLGANPDDLDVRVQRGVLRDMDSRRFRVLRAVAAEANYASARRQYLASLFGSARPGAQVFLGGELDVIPEAAQAPETPIAWGADRQFDVAGLCGGWRREIEACWPTSTVFRACEVNVTCGDTISSTCSRCDPSSLWIARGDRQLIGDIQGINEVHFGREHVVYLPDPDAPATVDPFVPSYTGTYGGARRRLTEPTGITADAAHGYLEVPGVLPEVQSKGGSVFVAHHLNEPSGSNGPEGPPWSDVMLDAAWRSPAVLGLEFWNENRRRYSSVAGESFGTPLNGVETGYERDDSQWWSSLQLVDDGRRALRWHSDGVFSLHPFDTARDLYDRGSFGVSAKLVDGTVSWDRMNLRGLDPQQTAGIAWLRPGEPRRMFMAGGSDAHGDFNYRREGYMTGTSEVNDTALGSPRNLVYVGAPAESLGRGTSPVFGARQVLGGLRAGHFAVTDGPALRIVYDANRNGVIDEGEPMMGDLTDLPAHQTLPLLVEWTSTAEFHPVDHVELVLGVLDSASHRGRVYAGGLGPQAGVGAPPVESYQDNGWSYARYPHDIWRASPSAWDPTDTQDLYVELSSPQGANAIYHAVHRFTLDLSRFHVAPGVTPDRVFVRAFVQTDRPGNTPDTSCTAADSLSARSGACVRRYAFTNPIWVRVATPLVIGPIDGVFLR